MQVLITVSVNLDPQWTGGNGKCGHGGPNDDKKDIVAIGGINKETSDLKWSPHYYLHQAAGEAAVQATLEFFVGKGTLIIIW